MNIFQEIRAERLIAKRYEECGYVVTLEPPPTVIPFSLGKYRPDILATRGDEKLIIEVKSPGARVDPEVYFQLDEQVRKHPGWRFLLVTVNEAELEESVASAGKNLNVESIRARLQSIDRVKEDADTASLLVPMLWTAYVSALRLLLPNEGDGGERLTDLSLLNKAYSAALISFDEYEAAKRLMDLRNRLVHSLDMLGTPADCRQLRQMIETVLNQLSPAHSAPTVQ